VLHVDLRDALVRFARILVGSPRSKAAIAGNQATKSIRQRVSIHVKMPL
jgi:hypothetical protein